MLIETTAGDLRLALNLVKPAIHRRNTIPILSCVFLKDGAARATDLDMEISMKFAASHFEGEVAVPGLQLFDLVSSLPFDMKIRLQRLQGDEHGVHIYFSGGRYRLPTLPTEDFPDFPKDDETKRMKAPDGLLAAIDAVRGAISTEETRYYLNGFCFSKSPQGKSVLVATDGHRLVAHDYDHDCDESRIVPRMALPALTLLPQPQSVFQSNRQMRFFYPGGHLFTKLIDGDFPDWHRVVPYFNDDVKSLRFSPLEMMRVLNRINKIAGSSRGRAVDISASSAGDMVVVASKGSDSEECAERLESGSAVNWSGPSEVRSFNTRYLTEICRLHRQADTISIVAADDRSPARIVPDNGKTLAILMPMRNGCGLVGKALLAFADGANDTAQAERAA